MGSRRHVLVGGGCRLGGSGVDINIKENKLQEYKRDYRTVIVLRQAKTQWLKCLLYCET